ncbi:MAG: hypothetical protein P4M14_01795 [Gammaproteobacteria bacterium]|nr:hypothetical protein [Gammaproteobacteria bacterium]
MASSAFGRNNVQANQSLPELFDAVVQSEKEFVQKMKDAFDIVQKIHSESSEEDKKTLIGYAAEFQGLAQNPIALYDEWAEQEAVNAEEKQQAFNAFAMKFVALLNDANSPLHKRIESYARWIGLVYYNPAAPLIWRAKITAEEQTFLRECLHLPEQRLYALNNFIEKAKQKLAPAGVAGAGIHPNEPANLPKTTKWPWIVSSFLSLAAIAAVPVAIFAFSVALPIMPLVLAIVGVTALGLLSLLQLRKAYAMDRANLAKRDAAPPINNGEAEDLPADEAAQKALVIKNSLEAISAKIRDEVNKVMEQKPNTKPLSDLEEEEEEKAEAATDAAPVAPPMAPAFDGPSASQKKPSWADAIKQRKAEKAATAGAASSAETSAAKLPAAAVGMDMMAALRARLAARAQLLAGNVNQQATVALSESATSSDSSSDDDDNEWKEENDRGQSRTAASCSSSAASWRPSQPSSETRPLLMPSGASSTSATSANALAATSAAPFSIPSASLENVGSQTLFGGSVAPGRLRRHGAAGFAPATAAAVGPQTLFGAPVAPGGLRRRGAAGLAAATEAAAAAANERDANSPATGVQALRRRFGGGQQQ